ncbi:MAG: NAD(P)-dependent oxidoreductase [Pseudomonadota bacterium]
MKHLLSLPNNAGVAQVRRRKRSARIGVLATLPVFLPLTGQKVVLAGGSEAAAWKGELLAASGAIVHVFAPTLDPVFSAVMAERPQAFVHHARAWTADCIAYAALALCDAASDGEAQAFHCAAKQAGVPVNVIDRPKFCSFQFGSIVNRSPVVISISTGGAAPILGQAIRRRIEAVVPASLTKWAQLAVRIRQTVLDRLAPGQDRRAFWDGFSAKALCGSAPSNMAFEELQSSIRGIASKVSELGLVWHIGISHGDPELLTLRDVRYLQSADIILHDASVPAAVLELGRREAVREAFCGSKDMCQRRLTELRTAGKSVVVLRGTENANIMSGEL